jgi:FkbM family methyltransferase
MKHLIVGSSIGTIALKGRDLLRRVRTPIELLGTLANDQITDTLVTRLCSPGKTFLDVGAHIGSVLAEVLRHSPNVKIQAFEAMPDKVERLRRKFPQIVVHQCAVGDVEGSASFFVDDRHSGYSSLAQKSANLREIRVSVKTLDTLVHDDDIDVIKIDVEGAELGVLRGALGIIRRCRPVVMFESGPEEVLGFTKLGMWEFLHAQSCGILLPNRVAHTSSPMTMEGFVESHFYPRRTTNYFAVPVERIAEVRAKARRVLGL